MGVKVKIQNREIELDYKDTISDNGSCVQITTRTKIDGYFRRCLVLSKKEFSRLLKNNLISLYDDNQNYRVKSYKISGWENYYNKKANKDINDCLNAINDLKGKESFSKEDRLIIQKIKDILIKKENKYENN